MPRTLTDLTEAEWQMLMILREEAASEGLKITIIAEPGQWHVRLESHEQGSSGDGWGHDFTSAWEDIVDPRLRAKAKSGIDELLASWPQRRRERRTLRQ